MAGPDAEDTTLIVTRLFDASPARVFDAWLIREEWQAWIGPEGMSCDVPLLEPHVGGRYRITMRLTDGRVLPVGGIFRAIDRPKTLLLTWGREDDPSRAGLLTLTFKQRGNATEFALRHAGLASVASRDDHIKGWNDALNKLERYLATRGPAAPRIEHDDGLV
jgi:uncharacterized protein YndB with AHSA1/START domain